MLTGLFPAAHGIHDNVTPPLPAERPFPMLAEQFRDAGYGTAAFVSSGVLAAASGIAQGFALYEGTEGALAGDERVKAAVKYIEGARGPWFVWVHLFDPHAPFFHFAGDGRRPATREGDPPQELYLGGVRRADAALEALLAAAGDAVVVLASDHGESFGEHDEPSHGALCYGTTADAVLAVRARGFAAGAADPGLRSVADVAPTLRRLCGLPAVPSDGRDLLGPPHDTLVTESLFTFGVHGWGQCFAVTDGEHTLVESGPRLEIFDRSWDAGETRPLPFTHPAYEKLDRALERFRSASAREYDGELHASLAAYGTMRREGSGYLPRHENAKRLDPRLHVAAWLRVEEIPWAVAMAVERKAEAPLEASLRLLEAFERDAGGSPVVPFHRARVYEAMAEVTGEPHWLVAAARQKAEAVARGFDREAAVLDAIRSAEAAQDFEALEKLAERVKGRELGRAVAEARARVEATQLTFARMR
jgi:hypothetical protein